MEGRGRREGRSGWGIRGEMDRLISNSLKFVVFLQIAVIKMKLFI